MALRNGAFLIAGAAAFWLWRSQSESQRSREWPALALIVVVVAVGIGSFVFHTLATRGAVLADAIPIAVFIYGYLLLALRRFLGLAAVGAVPIRVAYERGGHTLSVRSAPLALD